MTGKLLAQDFKRIGHPDVAPASDAFPQNLVDGTPEKLKAYLIALLGKDRVKYRALDLVPYASDASAYRLIPQVSENGTLPIVVDAASCTLGLLEDVGKHLDPDRKARHDQLDIRDSIT